MASGLEPRGVRGEDCVDALAPIAAGHWRSAVRSRPGGPRRRVTVRKLTPERSPLVSCGVATVPDTARTLTRRRIDIVGLFTVLRPPIREQYWSIPAKRLPLSRGTKHVGRQSGAMSSQGCAGSASAHVWGKPFPMPPKWPRLRRSQFRLWNQWLDPNA